MTQTNPDLISVAADQLRAQGADPESVADFEQLVTANVVAAMDAAIARVGKLLVDRGHAELWRDVYLVAFNRGAAYRTNEELDFLVTGNIG